MNSIHSMFNAIERLDLKMKINKRLCDEVFANAVVGVVRMRYTIGECFCCCETVWPTDIERNKHINNANQVLIPSSGQIKCW